MELNSDNVEEFVEKYPKCILMFSLIGIFVISKTEIFN